MTKQPRILVTRKLPDPVEARLGKDFDVVLNPKDRLMDIAGIIERSADFDGLLVCSSEKCDADFFAGLDDRTKIVATYSVGYDHIDAAAATARGVTITNTPDVLTGATADIALLLMLGAARGAYWGERMVREDKWGAWTPTGPLGLDVTGKRLGIIGMGRIGQAVAHRARAFDMAIHYHNRSRLAKDLEQGAVFHDQLDDMLGHCDFLSVNCASTSQTRGLINADALAKLPAGAVLINTARGDIVDDDALIEALKSGRLAAAGLDVFNNEPNLDARYRTLENVFLLPHLGSATLQTRVAMGMRAVDNLEAFFAGRTPGDVVVR